MVSSTNDFTPNMGFPYLLPSQAQKYVTVSESLRAQDVLVMVTVEARTLSVPPASPLEGAAYIIGVGASGEWAGHEDEIAVWQDDVWNYHSPQDGWRVWNKGESALVVYVGGDWAALSGGAGELQNLPLLGIGMAADAADPFSVKVNKGLFTVREAGNARIEVDNSGSYGCFIRLCDYAFTRTELTNNNGRAVHATASRRTLTQCEWSGNAIYALKTSAGYVIVFSAIVDLGDTATAHQFNASNGAVIEASETHIGGAVFSPAEGTSGNNGAMTI